MQQCTMEVPLGSAVVYRGSSIAQCPKIVWQCTTRVHLLTALW